MRSARGGVEGDGDGDLAVKPGDVLAEPVSVPRDDFRDRCERLIGFCDEVSPRMKMVNRARVLLARNAPEVRPHSTHIVVVLGVEALDGCNRTSTSVWSSSCALASVPFLRASTLRGRPVRRSE